ncbi:MAG: hypothetical protein FWE45_00610 [Firmicutes bacterium]|nr:hypothetical protein [Bacillota bacterium]
MKKRKIVVIGAVGGAGKNTVVKGLVEKYPDVYLKFPSVASREMRPNETQGDPYIFVSEKEFERMIKFGDVMEYTTMHGSYRGMSGKIIDEYGKSGKVLLNDCDYIGVKTLKKKYKDCVTAIFLDVSKTELEKRMRERPGTTQEFIDFRLGNYDKEYQTIKYYDHVVPNDDLEKCLEQIHKIVTAKHK